MVFCTKCGLQQAGSSKFCSECANPMPTPGGNAPSAPDMNARPPAFSPDSVMGAAGAAAGPSSGGAPNPAQTPPGCFLVQIPPGMKQGAVVTCTVPPPYPQVTRPASNIRK